MNMHMKNWWNDNCRTRSETRPSTTLSTVKPAWIQTIVITRILNLYIRIVVKERIHIYSGVPLTAIIQYVPTVLIIIHTVRPTCSMQHPLTGLPCALNVSCR